ncbi:28916_t:CDS:2 [Dentiscutata erythropus]|uniref:28916_t:CDS:1 n=1 Tax=Dentiscutata erythropus TaxID=1348616 RepID=A0A9N8ZF02_9GLOM|nr:28916_t:CDS:2 [Dentiscutata erythropus]
MFPAGRHCCDPEVVRLLAVCRGIFVQPESAHSLAICRRVLLTTC